MNTLIDSLFHTAHLIVFNGHDFILLMAFLLACLLAGVHAMIYGERYLPLFYLSIGVIQLNFLLTYKILLQEKVAELFSLDFLNATACLSLLPGYFLCSFVYRKYHQPLPHIWLIPCLVLVALLCLWGDPVNRFSDVLVPIFWRHYIFTNSIGFSISFIFTVLAFKKLGEIQPIIDAHTEYQRQWLRKFVLFFAVIFFAEFSVPLIHGLGIGWLEYIVTNTKCFATLLLLIIELVHELKQSKAATVALALTNHNATPQTEPAQDSFNNAEHEADIALILQAMEADKLYRQHGLTIETFSQHIGLAPRLVSQCINAGLGKNFYEFTNDFRLSEAETLLTSPAWQDKSVQRIYLEVGFKSKSSFNTLFKKQYGYTPSQYRENFLMQA